MWAPVLEPIGPRSAHAGAGGLVKPHRDIEVLASSPQRVVIRIVPGAVVEYIGPQKNRFHAQVAHGVFAIRRVDIVGDRGAVQAAGIGRW